MCEGWNKTMCEGWNSFKSCYKFWQKSAEQKKQNLKLIILDSHIKTISSIYEGVKKKISYYIYVSK